jgi:hypothetical protein
VTEALEQQGSWMDDRHPERAAIRRSMTDGFIHVV